MLNMSRYFIYKKFLHNDVPTYAHLYEHQSRQQYTYLQVHQSLCQDNEEATKYW